MMEHDAPKEKPYQQVAGLIERVLLVRSCQFVQRLILPLCLERRIATSVKVDVAVIMDSPPTLLVAFEECDDVASEKLGC